VIGRGVALVVLVVLAALVWSHRSWLPPEWDPSVPLDLQAASTPVTALKLALLNRDASLCRDALATAPVPTRAVPAMGGACPLPDPVRVMGGAVGLRPGSFLASCRLAVDWALFVGRAQAIAEAQAGQHLRLIEHLGSYACRDVRDRPGVESSHARADAIDVSAFVLGDGHRIAVSRWHDSGADGALLHALRDAACRSFGIVLSPDYNALHAGHLHLQAGVAGLCD